MNCPKCQSKNLYQLQDGRILCRNCENIFTSDQPLDNQNQAALKTPIKSNTDILEILQESFNKLKLNKNILKYAGISVILIAIFFSLKKYINRDPYICSIEEREYFLNQIDPLLKDWEDAKKLASSTARINLALPVSKLQDIQKEARKLKVPKCAEPVSEHFLDMTNETIDSFILFMQNAGDKIVHEKSISAEASEDSFYKYYYLRLKRGESVNILEITKQMSKDADKLIEESKQEIEKLKKEKKERGLN
jgi:uncharacterized Zn finger protein (UPF0148 family)